jgi:predicted nucleotidyltransferase
MKLVAMYGILRTSRLHDLGTLDSARAINADDEYAHKVESVVLFGSMLSEDKDRLGELDLAIELAPVTSDTKKLKLLYWYRRHVARANGRELGTVFSWAAWTQLEIFYLLKADCEASACTNYVNWMALHIGFCRGVQSDRKGLFWMNQPASQSQS